MSIDALELLLHPVRLRITNAMAGGRAHTTAELCARMPDISQATMYRQVAALADGGVLEVESEDRTRGPAERRYRLRAGAARIDPETGARMSLEEHRRAFAVGMGALLAEWNSYLDRDGADPYRDQVSYRQFVLWLEDKEVEALYRKIQDALAPLMGRSPAPGRTPHLLGTIFFPIERRSDDEQDPARR